ncbi:unnamed protein product [Amoebophrya sp. A25]|nr:unnamed protein product [Amoebophrya sp. A25]|eukprot:GSA25T00005317001.1
MAMQTLTRQGGVLRWSGLVTASSTALALRSQTTLSGLRCGSPKTMVPSWHEHDIGLAHGRLIRPCIVALDPFVENRARCGMVLRITTSRRFKTHIRVSEESSKTSFKRGDSALLKDIDGKLSDADGDPGGTRQDTAKTEHLSPAQKVLDKVLHTSYEDLNPWQLKVDTETGQMYYRNVKTGERHEGAEKPISREMAMFQNVQLGAITAALGVVLVMLLHHGGGA